MKRTFNPLDLVPRVIQGDESAVIELYEDLRRSIRAYLVGRLESTDDIADVCHDTFCDMLEMLRRGDLRHHEALFVVEKIIARRKAGAIRFRYGKQRRLERVHYLLPHHAESAFDLVWQNERVWLIRNTLLQLNSSRRELLFRFYIQEQDKDSIIREMRLTETTFRLRKNRAKDCFAKIGRKLLGVKV